MKRQAFIDKQVKAVRNTRYKWRRDTWRHYAYDLLCETRGYQPARNFIAMLQTRLRLSQQQAHDVAYKLWVTRNLIAKPSPYRRRTST